MEQKLKYYGFKNDFITHLFIISFIKIYPALEIHNLINLTINVSVPNVRIGTGVTLTQFTLQTMRVLTSDVFIVQIIWN